MITDMGEPTLIWRKTTEQKNGGIAPPFSVLQFFSSHHLATWGGILDASILCEIQQAYFIQSDDKEHLHLLVLDHYCI